ncbi:MAG: exodeoxyribonuclease VII small subunit [Clostridia bacterium]|nr:exodeoxyribonuclease VII small subunit [Clostridia bacterium]
MAAKKKLTFEDGMQSLEELITQIESGEMPLEKSFDTYEHGMKLIKELWGILDAGEKRLVAGKAELRELTESGEAILRMVNDEDAV